MDKETEDVLKQFTGLLEELKFNSGPIITSLTKIAEENIGCAQYFVDAIEARIEKCVPGRKLFTFYALDSICKNAGSPYTIYFSRNLYSLYKSTYLIVDNTTRTKMISMFKTWMTPSETTALPLFDMGVLERIEQFLIKASALHQRHNDSQVLPKPNLQLLLREIDKLSDLTSERLITQPNDSKLQTKLVVLQQLKLELQKSTCTAQDLNEVQLQLKQVFAQDQKVIHERLKSQQLEQQHQNQQILQKQSSSSQMPFSLFGIDNSGATSSLFGNIPMGILPPSNFLEIEKTNKLKKLEQLYQDLEANELLYVPRPASIVTLYDKLDKMTLERQHDQQHRSLPPIHLLQDIISDCKALSAINNVDVVNNSQLQLTTDFICNDNNNTFVQTHLVHLLYRGKPNKCSICGKRFGNTVEEQNLQNEHLDWHFRINKRIKGTSISNINGNSSTSMTQKNIQSRNWYLSGPEWIQFSDLEIVASSRKTNFSELKNPEEHANKMGLGSDSNGSNVNNGKDNQKDIVAGDFETGDMKSIQDKYIIVPESAQDMAYTCPICTETVTGIYDEDSGEWIWKNTVSEGDKYFHATCFHETSKNHQKPDSIQTNIETLKNLVSR